MSTLPGQASKGEKSKSKFQSLDINSLYRVSRGENLEKQQQKSSSVYIKHGMQSLGKVPNARRAPANLPSLKAEHSGSDAAVPLVPPGASGWGKQEANASPGAPPVDGQRSAAAPAQSQSQPAQQQQQQHPAGGGLPATNAIPHKQLTPTAQPAPVDKLWSSVMSGQDAPHPPLYQSPQFQHEFPSLSAGDGGPTRTGSDAPQYPTGLSLRPQTEGSWTQGGQRPGGPHGTGGENAGQGRPNSGPQGAPAQHSAQAGQPQQHPFPPQMRGVMPSFMCKGSGFQQGPPGNGVQHPQNAPQSVNGRGGGRGAEGRPHRPAPEREVEDVPRPIIKEEELTRMDAIGKDMGWAESDEIDYNQKLAFSDDEGDKNKRRDGKKTQPSREHKEERESHGDSQPRQWGAPRTNARGRSSEEEDVWMQRRNQTDKEVEIAVQRAKQRKEEEEKRFDNERKQAAAKKLMELEEKIQKRDRDSHESVATINPVAVPSKPINHVDIPLPEFQKDKDQDRDRETRSRTPNEPSEEKSPPQGNSFRQLTQIDAKTFPQRKQHARPTERDNREQNPPNFSRNFQNDLPPRFLKHQRNNSSSNLQNQQQPQYTQQQFDNRWQSNNQNNVQKHPNAHVRNVKQDEAERESSEQKEYARQSSEDSYRSSHHSQQESSPPKALDKKYGEERKDKDEDNNRQKEKVPERKHAEDWSDHREKPRDDWPQQRPDSRSTRQSRDSDYLGGWSEPTYEEKRRVVPGPITKDRIEADDMRSEKRNLTQLKRGQPVEVRSEIRKLEEEKKEAQFASAWADSIPPAIEELQAKKLAEEKKSVEEKKVATEQPKKQDKPEDYNRGKPYGQKKGWGNNDYPRGQPWSGRNRGGRTGGYHGTDSDGSMDDHQKTEERKSPRQEKKKDNYVPRGEPSRHGRGGSGGSFRSGRMSSMGKKIDGYGPPPTKSPFGGRENHPEEKQEETVAPAEDKVKQNQQALAAGIIGKRSEPPSEDKNKARGKPDARKNKPKVEEVASSGKPRPAAAQARGRNGNPPAGRNGDKRYDANGKPVTKDTEEKEESGSANGDSEGFQEVKSKKAVKERQKSEDKSKGPKVEAANKGERDRDRDRGDRDRDRDRERGDRDRDRGERDRDRGERDRDRGDRDRDRGDRDRDRGKNKMSSATQQLTQQQIQNIPSLMATPVNPPPVLPQPKGGFDRGRQTSKLPPRFAKQKMQKLEQKQAMQQQQQHGCDVGENQMYGMKEAGGGGVAAPPPTCAWDKPLVTQMRSIEQDAAMLSVTMEAASGGKGMEAMHSPSQVNANNEKMLSKPNQLQDKPHLDGTTAPVNTLIFENTNFKSAPGARPAPRGDKPRPKMDADGGIEMPNFGESKAADALFKEDAADMKIDFFVADLQFSEEKTAKSFVAKSMHSITSGNNTVDSLDIKIASVKKVWDTSEQEGEDNQITFGGAPLDSNVFNQSKDSSEDNHEGYSPSQNQTAQTNVCKVKPTQQVSGGGQTSLSAAHQPHAGMVAGMMGNPLSPPPMPPVLGAGVGMGPQYTANQHIGYQTGLSGSTQYGISAIPSPPNVPLVYNSSQQLQSAVQTAGLYGAFQLDQLSGQGRSPQYSQYANYHGLGQTANSPYSAQSVYLQTPPHPPPSAQAPPELYQNAMSNYRLSAAAAATPFGQNQQLNNPTTVLISSTSSNSLMSASVKPSGQQISAIGTKAGGVGQAYQQQSQQGQQVFMAYDPSIQANYLASNAGVMQRAPVGPAQNNVVPGLQGSNSYYSGSTGGQAGFYQPPGNSTMPAQHQAGYGLQGSVFGAHSQSHANTGLQNYNSHFLTAPMQVAAALSAQQQQQFRSSLSGGYMKGVGGGQPMGDQSGRSQQLKSPGSQEVLSSVFNSGPQIASPKSRQNMKHPPQQPSPTSQHKFNMYQGPQNMNMQRYPTPIQRPINFQQIQQNSVNQKHRNNPNHNNKPSNRYYSNQNHSLSGQSEKCDDGKMTDGGSLGSSNTTGSAKTGPTSAVDKVKENVKEETVALKD